MNYAFGMDKSDSICNAVHNFLYDGLGNKGAKVLF